MQRYLQCAEQQESASNFSKYCACQEKWLSRSTLFTHETLFTMRGGTSVIVQTHQILRLPRKVTLPLHRILRLPRKMTLQLHQILRLPRKMTLMINPRHTWNAIYNARNNRWHPPTSPNTAPATPNDSPKFQKHFSKTDETSIPMRDRSETVPRMIRAWSEHDPSMKPSLRNPPRNRGYFSRPPRAFCIEKYNISRSGYHSKFHRILRLPRKVTLQLHQILRLPRKMNLMIDPCHTWNAIYNARSNKCHCPNSPNTAPATKNESHDWSLSHMKRYLQCAEQPVASSNITKYCACHAKWSTVMTDPRHIWNAIYNARNNRWHPPTSPNTAPATQNDSLTFQRNFSKTAETSFPMRGRSELDPSWIRAGSELDPSRIRAGNRHPQPASQPRLLFRTTTSILYWKIQHFALRLSFQISPNTAPATKSDTSTSPNTAPATKSDTWTSPNNAPATKSDTWTSQNSDTNLISSESLLKRI